MMHERKGNYMPCKWKRKKGGCHGLLSRGREGKLAEYFTRGDAHTTKNVNLLVFLIVPLPSSLIRCLFRIFLRFYFLGSLFNPLSFFSRIFLFFLSPAVHSFGRVRTKKLVQDGRTELILRARKAKGGPPSLEFHGALC